MKLATDDRDVLYHLVVLVVFGCCMATIFGCGSRISSNDSANNNPQKINRPLPDRNVVEERIATRLNRHLGNSAPSSGLTSEQQEKNGARISAADAEITHSIKAALQKDPRLSPFGLEVATVNGEVTLKGETSSIELRTVTEQVAVSRSGVSKVNNLIRVTWVN